MLADAGARTAVLTTIGRACGWWSCSRRSIPAFPGLNLTFEVLDGLRKHGEATSPTLEAQIADLADEITYYSHDLDDALDFAILDGDQLDESLIWQRSHERVGRRNPDLLGAELHKTIIRDIIDLQVRDVVATSAGAIAAAAPVSVEEARRQSAPLIRYSEELEGGESRAAPVSLRECLLSSARGGGEPARLRDAAESFSRRMSRSRNGSAMQPRAGSRAKGCIGRCAITSRG